ncbi:type I-E CRISPR-associated protein Cas7/Cse4/CasC [Streptomyces goshikiensis]|uniref:type I-E CRISPR-associated protein Cas7/Cse4/CasC n=1 Tax=Streptomyces TaxID=1883 RepID=UPI00064D3163|nr:MULTISPECIES: type I-E CRISPR-associated protein Cas7/Cse4/CasC [unclassified Streptomyces]AKL64130.1 CRISPR-associated protein Cse4 [Streptomyces sp. Mg1]RPK44866.1 CRISPR system Cascade subunit CasC [Streptomyces sp. ADI91-18]WSX95762.1 type I-E CRISPR-associated protein Cas7/Cse4/CasC [Streptomyces goshikiensis]
MTSSTARFIDIHVLHPIPFSNLNRDDANAVKTLQYGGTLRTRVSSQCWKRAAREDFQTRIGQAALRTRRIGERVARELSEREWPADLALRAGGHLAAGSSIKFELAKDKDKEIIPNLVLTNAMVYVPETAVSELADLAEEFRTSLEAAKDIKKPADKSVLPKDRIEAILRSRNGVINLFGRMLAEVDEAGVDGAVQVAHALTTHTTDVEVDYFSAVDDITAAWKDSTGSGHMGHAEYSAGTFYRFATVDLRDLTANIGDEPDALRELTAAFLSAFIESVPHAKKNSTAPHTLPSLIHLSVRTDRPVSYAAAFEKPVHATETSGFAEPSANHLSAYAQAANAMLGNARILTSGFLSIDSKDLPGLGIRHGSLDELLETTLARALNPAPAGTSA